MIGALGLAARAGPAPRAEPVARRLGALREQLAPKGPRGLPWGMPLLLVPTWATYLTMEQDHRAIDNPLLFHPPTLTEEPARVLLNLAVTPLVNTITDQAHLVTGLLLTFGLVVELRYGTWAALGVFWLTSAAAALVAGAMLHVLYPLFPDVHLFADGGWNRTFSGGSAGGYGLMAAFAATARHPWFWLAMFVIWEANFFLFIGGDYTSVFHLVAVATGLLCGLWLRARRNSGAGVTA